MKLDEILKVAKKPKLKEFDYFTKLGPFSLNGYVVIPDDFPLDYYDEFYRSIDDEPIGGMTFGGYFTLINGNLEIVYRGVHLGTTEENEKNAEKIKDLCVRCIGFDDSQAWPIDLTGTDGAKYLANELKKLAGKSNEA